MYTVPTTPSTNRPPDSKARPQPLDADTLAAYQAEWNQAIQDGNVNALVVSYEHMLRHYRFDAQQIKANDATYGRLLEQVYASAAAKEQEELSRKFRNVYRGGAR